MHTVMLSVHMECALIHSPGFLIYLRHTSGYAPHLPVNTASSTMHSSSVSTHLASIPIWMGRSFAYPVYLPAYAGHSVIYSASLPNYMESLLAQVESVFVYTVNLFKPIFEHSHPMENHHEALRTRRYFMMNNLRSRVECGETLWDDAVCTIIESKLFLRNTIVSFLVYLKRFFDSRPLRSSTQRKVL